MSTCEGCQYDFSPQDTIMGFCRDCVIDQHSDKIGRLQAELAALRTDSDELRWALQGLLALYESPEDEIGGVERIMLNKVRKLLEDK